ncbi:hypothetical protein DPEC_G00056040 [Dallia pectoralis]|uniref:Uncharacterized protein n=1 Tax=Dallia pectoralis TaxID=75939 RepID=A0ACC2H5K6_DALPE|nr:hypothetical protein DPEC_G00056040 [Dallia pectoralis]
MWWSGACVKSDFIPMACRWGLALLVILLNGFGHCTALTRKTVSMSSTVLGPNLKGTAKGEAEPSNRVGDVRYGRLVLGRDIQPNKEGPVDHSALKVKFPNGSSDDDYQSDTNWAWDELEHTEGEDNGSASSNSAAVERLLKMEPRVECVGDSMNLKVHDTGSTPGSLFFVNRGTLQSPLPLSNLPESCGHSLKGTPRDWSFHAPYSGCFVTRENDYYVIPLLWLGLPLKMSCPAEKPSNASPPMVSCYPEGMVVKIHGISANDLQMKFKEQWQSLMSVSSYCGYSVVTRPDGVVVSACYKPCVEPLDGMFTLELAGLEGEIQMSCPHLPVSDIGPTDPQLLPCISESSNKPCLTAPTPGKVYRKPKPPSKVVDLEWPSETKLNPVPPNHVQPSLPPKIQAPQHPFYTKPAEKPDSVTLSPLNPKHYFPFQPRSERPVTYSPEEYVPEKPQVPWYPGHTHPRPEKPVTYPPEEHVPEKPQVPWYPDPFHLWPAKPVPQPTPATGAPNGRVRYPYYTPLNTQPPKHGTHPHFTPMPTPAENPDPENKINPATKVFPGHVKIPYYNVPEPSDSTTQLKPHEPHPPRPADCLTVCPTGFSNCCPAPISFHQHHHNHFGPVVPKDGGIVPVYPFEHLSDLLQYASVPVHGPIQTTATPQTNTDQTTASTERSLSFHDFWIRHALRLPAAADPNRSVLSSDLKKPSEFEAQTDSAKRVQPYHIQQSVHQYNLNNHPNGQAPSSSSKYPTEQQRPMRPYLPYNTKRFMHPYNQQGLMYPDPMPYNSQSSNRQAPLNSNKPFESLAFSSDPNGPLKPQHPKRQLFRPPPQDEPDGIYTSDLLESNHQTSRLETPKQRSDQPMNTQEQPRDKPELPKQVDKLVPSRSRNSESVAGLQQPISSDQQMPTSYVSSLPIYHAGSKPFHHRKPPAKLPSDQFRHELPESLTHYWNPVMPLPANQKLHEPIPAQPTGSQNPAANQLNVKVHHLTNANNGADHRKQTNS